MKVYAVDVKYMPGLRASKFVNVGLFSELDIAKYFHRAVLMGRNSRTLGCDCRVVDMALDDLVSSDLVVNILDGKAYGDEEA